jgi:hypothetical protein
MEYTHPKPKQLQPQMTDLEMEYYVPYTGFGDAGGPFLCSVRVLLYFPWGEHSSRTLSCAIENVAQYTRTTREKKEIRGTAPWRANADQTQDQSVMTNTASVAATTNGGWLLAAGRCCCHWHWRGKKQERHCSQRWPLRCTARRAALASTGLACPAPPAYCRHRCHVLPVWHGHAQTKTTRSGYSKTIL